MIDNADIQLSNSNIDSAINMSIAGFRDKMKSHVKRIILYGSCARDEYTDDSDIDIAILTDCSRSEAKKYDSELMDVVTDIAMKTSEVVEYICIPNDEYEDKKEWYGFFKNIDRDGKIIYG